MMIVEDNKTLTPTILCCIKDGSTFEYHGYYYLKADESEDGCIACVSLCDGMIKRYPMDMEVEPVNAKVVIE